MIEHPKDVQAWMDKTNDDLLWAKHSLTGNFWPQVCFISQQAVEKALKGYLVSQNFIPPKIHNLEILLKKCLGFDPDFGQWQETAKKLNVYYVEVRYPDILEATYTESDAKTCLSLAQQLVDFITQKIVV